MTDFKAHYRLKPRHWAVAIAAVLSAYGAVVWAVSHHWPSDMSQFSGGGAPIVFATYTAAPSHAPSQMQRRARPKPTVAPSEEPVKKKQNRKPAPAQSREHQHQATPAVHKPEPMKAAKIPEETVSDEKVEQVTADIEQPVTEKDSPELQPNRQETASAARAAEKKAAQHTKNKQERLAGQRANWQSLLAAHLEKKKRYPRLARQQRAQGTSVVRFVIAANGETLHSEITQTSGHFLLDREVRALLQRAQPLPTRPDSLRGKPLEVIVPVRFSLR
ncbi:energy transducer TonB [Gilvimarinus agarilyticus]|uniref:energy transducer TonB n=1 Tax=Gilvimarinus sp. 2_MG-2023 TaxID=3062666 RepID=UPI001C0950C8|nr:energy transducer TonB [Gilvimarinus sp. 2_MG-2023]MBU2887438.1 energy transducer TonB [Gilvimarinus agarilyticus]MDO6572097.1 energy transducer TonB [Gilvimarinus sp. 2_MG-2023]